MSEIVIKIPAEVLDSILRQLPEDQRFTTANIKRLNLVLRSLTTGARIIFCDE